MPKKYAPEEFWKLYERLPKDLQDAMFSEEVANDTQKICERNDIKDSGKFVDLLGNVFLGLLHPSDFSYSLIEELDLDEKTAKKVATETERFIFYHVQKGLAILYKVKFGSPSEGSEKPSEKKSGPREKDTYRESIEED